MNVVVTVEQRFDRSPDGGVWTPAQFPYAFWTRYLDVFSSVRVVARVRDVPAIPDGWQRTNGDGVSVASVPYYVGPWQFLRQRHRVIREARRSIGSSDAVILRVPSVLGSIIADHARRTHRPYGVEVVSDPSDVFGPNGVHHPLRPYFHWSSVRGLRRLCTGACAASYVSERTLQQRYPCGGLSVHYSSIQLSDTDFAPHPRTFHTLRPPITLITVATLAQLYKGTDTLIDALAQSLCDGLDARLVIVGDGRHRASLEARAAQNGLQTRVHFTGQLTTPAAVRERLREADLFVLPSRAEGVPRAMIEAMARALPCIGSTVGGIPELIPSEDMVAPNDAHALAQKIQEVIGDPGRMARMSERNLLKAAEYGEDRLGVRRRAFFDEVRMRTHEWLNTHPELQPSAVRQTS